MENLTKTLHLILLSIISLVFIFRLLHLQIFTSDFKLLSEQNIVQENIISLLEELFLIEITKSLLQIWQYMTF